MTVLLNKIMSAQNTLYNKYRPQTFADIVDQNHIKITLQNELVTNKLAHAYLFTGPRGVGKTTIARILAKAVNCQQRTPEQSEPCNVCSNCLEVSQNKFLDLVEIDAASQTKVEQTRENIIAAARVSASSGRTKIFIIDEVHMLSTSSFNALLKTLEEPPAKVIFILATTEIHKVPETIISRCQRFDFHRISVDDLEQWLEKVCQQEKVEYEKTVLQLIAKQAEGGARDAISLLGQVLALSDNKVSLDQASLILPRSDLSIVSDLVSLLLKKQAAEAIELLNKSLEEGIDLVQLVKELIDYLRQGLLIKIQGDKTRLRYDLDKNYYKLLQEQMSKTELTTVLKMLDIMLEKYLQIKNSVIPQLPIELAFVLISDTHLIPVAIEVKQNEKKIEAQLIKKNTEPEEQIEYVPITMPVSEVAKEQPVKKNITQSKKEESLAADQDKKLSITWQQLPEKWPDFLKELKQYNHSLAAIAQICHPIKLVNNELIVGFQYSFHQESMSNVNNQNLIEAALAKVYGEKIIWRPIVDSEYEQREAWQAEVNSPENLDSTDTVDVAEAFS